MNPRAIAIAALVLGAACGTEPIRAAPPTNGGAGGGTVTPTGPFVVTMNDGQSAAALTSLNNAELQVAQSVMARLTQQEVFDYGQLMITEHTADDLEEATILMQQGITPQATSLTQAIQASAQALVDQLQPLNGTALNSAYINSQVLQHQQDLALIDCVLLPNLKNAALRGMVTGMVRPEDAEHLIAAVSLSASLGGAQASVGVLDGGVGTVPASNCAQVCTPISSGGLLTDPLRAASCTNQ